MKAYDVDDRLSGEVVSRRIYMPASTHDWAYTQVGHLVIFPAVSEIPCSQLLHRRESDSLASFQQLFDLSVFCFRYDRNVDSLLRQVKAETVRGGFRSSLYRSINLCADSRAIQNIDLVDSRCKSLLAS